MPNERDVEAAEAALRAAGLTPEATGADGWPLAVAEELARRASTVLIPPERSARRTMKRAPGFLTPEVIRKVQEVNRRLASPAEIARAEALGDRQAFHCQRCEDSRVLGVVSAPGALAVWVPCECVTPEERADMAGVPRRFRTRTALESYEALPGKAKQRAIAARWDCRRSVVLTGDPGVGKTHLAVVMLMAAAADRPALFQSVPDLMDDLRARFDDGAKEQSGALFRRVAEMPVLLLDDLGKEQETDWTAERIATLVDSRYRAELPTIITTNESHQGLGERYGDHFGDRLFEFEWIVVKGVSMREQRRGLG